MDTVGMRLQVPTDDIDPAQNAGALYFAEGQYVAADDAAAGNALNNASYRRVTIPGIEADPVFFGLTRQRDPAIRAWPDHVPDVTLVAVDSVEDDLTARYWIGGRASDNGDGTWHYEYAVFNLNSHRSAGSFSVPVPAGATVLAVGFHAPASHSGEPYSNAPWSSTVSADSITFSTDDFSVDPNANALRWSTMYNFRFDADVPPGTGTVTIGLFRPGTPTTISAASMPVPGTIPCPGPPDGDLDVNGIADGQDLAPFVTALISASSDPAHLCHGDFSADGVIEINDVPGQVDALLFAP
jgi:hypothetical protein